ncbi:hypothetical protein CL614_03500 [archaeon]|nr:hypothetical protein [archaeon]
MPRNDPANDRYNPPGTSSVDFEKFNFGELEVDELFWQTDNQTEDRPWRKINQTQATDLKTQTTHSFRNDAVVYQKT